MCFAIAIKCVVQLLDAPIALATTTAFSNALQQPLRFGVPSVLENRLTPGDSNRKRDRGGIEDANDSLLFFQ